MNPPRHDNLDNPPDYDTLRDDYWALRDLADMLDHKIQKLEAVIYPFARYAAAHGAMSLLGRNGAVLQSEAWENAINAMKL